MATQEDGTVDVLSCGNGHTTLNFNSDDPLEVERAGRVVSDMLRRGYALFHEGKDGKLRRVKGFDKKKTSYIIAVGPEPTAEQETQDDGREPTLTKTGGKKRKTKTTSVPAGRGRVTAVAPSAGG